MWIRLRHKFIFKYKRKLRKLYRTQKHMCVHFVDMRGSKSISGNKMLRSDRYP